MQLSILKSKIHRATVTDANIHYMGSITIDAVLMDHAKILQYEKVLVASLESGERLETYAIEGKRGSGEICLNGAAARKILKDDKVFEVKQALKTLGYNSKEISKALLKIKAEDIKDKKVEEILKIALKEV